MTVPKGSQLASEQLDNWESPFRHRHFLWLVPFAVLTVFAYSPSFDAPFIFDDISAIVDNPNVRSLWPLSEAASAPPQTPLAGRPVASLSFALTYAVVGMAAFGHRLFNLTLHFACAGFIYGLMCRALRAPAIGEPVSRRASSVAAIVAGLWMLHPLVSEAVIYIVQRTELLFAFFLLATMYCAMRGFESSRGRWWSMASVVCCALGMGSKEVMVSAPLLVLLFDRTFLSGSFREALRRRAGLYVGLVFTWGILAALMSQQLRSASVGLGHGVSSLDYVRTQACVIAWYLRLVFIPYPLSIAYDDWPIAEGWGGAIAPGLLVVGLLTLTVWLLIRKPAAGFCGAWFFLILAPTSSFMPIVTEVAAERRMYLPLLAPIAVIVVGLAMLAMRRTSSSLRSAMCVAGVAVTIAAARTTFVRAQDYATELSIWQATARTRPASRAAHMNLGNVLLRAGRSDEAIDQYRRVIELDPTDAKAHYNLANALAAAGKSSQALGSYREAIRIAPKDADAHHNYGIALCNLGQTNEGIAQYREAIRLNPRLEAAYGNLSIALRRVGQLADARRILEDAVSALPQSVGIRVSLADILLDMEDFAGAIEHYQQVLRTEPDRIGARMNFAVALAMAGRSAEAANQLRELLRRKPDHANARRMLADLERTKTVGEP